MTDTEIRARAENYIDEALADANEKPSGQEREAAIERVEEATRKLADVSQHEPFAC